MDAIFRIKGDEFDETLFQKIKVLLRSANNSSVVIQVTDDKDAYDRALAKSIGELNQPDNLLQFSMESLETYHATKKNK